MSLDLERMLEKCKAQQWRAEDLDWSASPRPMSELEETTIVQYLTDMAAIERFAGALFAEQAKIVSEPVLREIFATFVVDEERHAQVAEQLARHYDVHRYRSYRRSPELERFRRHFLSAIHFLSAEIANAYITGGELLLDIALLRSLNDYIHDDMSARAMELINRDESRHIALDYYMTEYYASPDYRAWLDRQPRKPLSERVSAWRAFAGVLVTAGPFFQDVFFEPMARLDPAGKRIREAVKRMQLLGRRANVAERPFYKFLNALNETNNHPVLGPIFGRLSRRLSGNFPEELSRELFTAAELSKAQQMSMSELADEALHAKLLQD